MAKKELLLGAVAAGLMITGYSAPALAAKGEGKQGPRGARMIERLDTDKDGKVSRDEFRAGVETAFPAFDTDGNGEVTREEMKARHQAFRDARKAARETTDADWEKAREELRAMHVGFLPGAGRMFERTDTDKSGSLSKAEVLAAADALFERRDRDKDGALSVADAGPRKGDGKRHGREQRGERMFQRLDLNGDGKLSQEELVQRASGAFLRFDADGDGTVTKAEVDSRRDAFREAREAIRKISADDRGARREARQAMREARIRPMAGHLFEKADANADGNLTRPEMETAVADMLKARDKNADGALTPDEFGKRMK